MNLFAFIDFSVCRFIRFMQFKYLYYFEHFTLMFVKSIKQTVWEKRMKKQTPNERA